METSDGALGRLGAPRIAVLDGRPHHAPEARPAHPPVVPADPPALSADPPALSAASRPEPPSFDARQAWAANRLWMETANLKNRRYGGKRRHHGLALLAATRAFDWALRAIGQHERGYRNACDLALRELDHPLERLPAAFDGFTILHLSDLHLDGMPELVDLVLAAIGDRRFDLCVLTGDYRTELHGPIRPVLRSIARLLPGLRAEHGVVAVLGNHDDCDMVPPLEAMGVRMLINEQVEIERGAARLTLVGTDDVHYYYTDQALHALERAAEAPCSVALVHSPELYDVAADLGIDLYLCGHTHGGQVCLPGGIPIITHLSRGRRYFRGVWQHGRMRGVTHCGTGTSGIPIRFNTRGEILVHRLRAR
jgi:predicted MPP superfamily phosphohydrolase